MATIKEITLKAYPVKMVKTYGYLPGGNITEKDVNLPERKAMELGANAVLEEIETFVRKNCWNTEDKNTVFSKIKELKGE